MSKPLRVIGVIAGIAALGFATAATFGGAAFAASSILGLGTAASIATAAGAPSEHVAFGEKVKMHDVAEWADRGRQSLSVVRHSAAERGDRGTGRVGGKVLLLADTAVGAVDDDDRQRRPIRDPVDDGKG